ncbi:unnamed protein product [Rotaria sordida]|uniref:alpha-L-fucosidase n=5 Tax=Rotaria sordida TaxID=392033 RepID=A0A814RWR6_9BILA|nr:unnamed protein product [Rotaria sordida]CAF1523674.1 unnamed protein product [Rotaria sordida]CAF1662829.1 unnamed protein product [Rotaria sordida]
MKTVLLLLLLLIPIYDCHLFRYQWHQRRAPPSSKKYRISPTTGVRIALPTPEQLQWQAQELGVLIHFNIATYINDDGCSGQFVPNISLFNPYLLNTDNWVQTMLDFGAKYAVLVAKHACGFHMAPTDVKFPLSPSGQIIPYNYSIDYSPMKGVDVLGNFVKSCEKKQIRTGFYYTVVSNNWLNVDSGLIQNRTLKPGQINITQETYNSIVLQQLREIWSRYGSLDEIWFDGGYTSTLKDPITTLLAQLQPQAIAFNGYGVSTNPARWIGTEMGVAPDPNWSTGITNDGGDPNSPIFCPAECDTTLQAHDRWFWGVNATLRSLSELIQVYHETVGRNCLLMLDLTPDRTGLIPPVYARLYKQLGDFIRSCYGTSILPTEYLTLDDSKIHIQLFISSPVTVDRSVIQEDQTRGQVIRAYTIDVQLVNSTDNSQWITVAQGTSIGSKKIDIWSEGPQLINAVRLTITKSVDKPVIKSFTVHLCT